MAASEEKQDCWVSYDSATTDFPIQNLPYGVFQQNGDTAIGVAIGDSILNLKAAVGCKAITFSEGAAAAFQQSTLNDFMALGRAEWTDARNKITAYLSGTTPPDNSSAVLVKQGDATMILPAKIGDYTDFYSSRPHATNIGTMFRGKENALMPNWLHLPVGYHGRASSVVVSGTPIKRPNGQRVAKYLTGDQLQEQGRSRSLKAPASLEDVQFTSCKLLDFEMEMALFVGTGNTMGEPISMKEARDKIFGLVLMNDWSARDIQKWEYVPLGPFNGKNFGTTISPWIVTLDALAPFTVEVSQDPKPLSYLQGDVSSYDIKLQVSIQPDGVKDEFPVCNTNFKNLYWSCEQQLVHHSSTGCPMQTGDLCGSGTISGPEPGSFGSMLEISAFNKETKALKAGSCPLTLPNGETRKFLKDGDNVVMTGYCQADGYRIGFGRCEGTILPANKLPEPAAKVQKTAE